MKGNKGITLIALVITIIVLLILAAVSIAMLTGDNSILGNASKSADYNKIGEVKDQISLKVSEYVSSFLEAKYNGENYIAGELGEKTTVNAVDDALVACKADENIGSYITYSTGSTSITVKSGKYQCTGTVDQDKGSVKWNPISEVSSTPSTPEH